MCVISSRIFKQAPNVYIMWKQSHVILTRDLANWNTYWSMYLRKNITPLMMYDAAAKDYNTRTEVIKIRYCKVVPDLGLHSCLLQMEMHEGLWCLWSCTWLRCIALLTHRDCWSSTLLSLHPARYKLERAVDYFYCTILQLETSFVSLSKSCWELQIWTCRDGGFWQSGTFLCSEAIETFLASWCIIQQNYIAALAELRTAHVSCLAFRKGWEAALPCLPLVSVTCPKWSSPCTWTKQTLLYYCTFNLSTSR